MLEPLELVEDIAASFVPKTLAGRRALLTAGPTFEPIDPVRGLTNRSSGKMGFALARALRDAGAEVVLVAGPTALDGPRGIRRIDVETAQQMHDAVMNELDGAAREGRNVDLFVGVAAVADWRVANASATKWKKDDDGRAPPMELVENPDILATVARRPDAPYCVGFAAESEKLEEHGAAKRARKGVPLLVANLGPDTFGRDDNELLLIDASGTRRIARADKDALSRALVDELARRLSP
jgi:phosphopantothenoylcysteine decarboxylase/phosphopantothenate--cysteine ligase